MKNINFKEILFFNNNCFVLSTLAILGLIVTIFSAFPGHTNFDEFNSLNEYLGYNLSAIQPPLHSIIWGNSIIFGKYIGLKPIWQASLLFFLQIFLFWLAAYYFASLLKNKFLAIVFLLVLIITPLSMLYIGHIGKDSQMAISFFLTFLLIFKASKEKSKKYLFFALFFLLYGFLIRSNAPAAAIPIIFYWSSVYIKNFSNNSIYKKIILFSSVLILFLITQSYLNSSLKHKDIAGIQLVMTPIHELMGLSIVVNENLVPKKFYRDDSFTLDYIKEVYVPTYPYWDKLKLTGYEYFPDAYQAWVNAIKKYPKEYINLKINYLKIFYGFNFGPVPFSTYYGFYLNDKLVQSKITEELTQDVKELNPKFLKIKNIFKDYIISASNSFIYRPWIYIFIGISLLILSHRKGKNNEFCAWLAFSAILYTAPYIIISSSVSIRYNLWTIFAFTLISFLKIDEKIK
jgi:hypothetical protein